MDKDPTLTAKSTVSLPLELEAMQKVINTLSLEDRLRLQPYFDLHVLRIERDQKTVQDVSEIVGTMRLHAKYLEFDLEATKNERNMYRDMYDDLLNVVTEEEDEEDDEDDDEEDDDDEDDDEEDEEPSLFE